MKTLYKYILAAALCTSIMPSCIISTVMEEINKTVGKTETPPNSKTNSLHTGNLTLQIKNNAPNVMYAPLSGTITANRNNILLIELYPNSPLYCLTNNQMTKVLQTIQFTVSVEEWQNGQ